MINPLFTNNIHTDEDFEKVVKRKMKYREQTLLLHFLCDYTACATVRR